MLTLTFGFKKPETGDKGTVFFPALEDNIQQLNDHNHDGVNSSKLPATSIEAISQDVLSGSFADLGDDIHRALVTMPGSLQFDTSTMQFEINSGADTGFRFFPSYQKVSANTFYVFMNEPLDIKVIYS